MYIKWDQLVVESYSGKSVVKIFCFVVLGFNYDFSRSLYTQRIKVDLFLLSRGKRIFTGLCA